MSTEPSGNERSGNELSSLAPSWRRPITSLAILLIVLYQRTLSRVLGANCRFQPTCSQYTRLAIEKYGVIGGIWRGGRRILRCHPWHPGGYDPP